MTSRGEVNAFDQHMMAIALRVGLRGLGQTAPNPAVGAVVADEATGEVIARGWTQPGGRPHAETEAIRRAAARCRGATLYVTLEPCAHHGKTPPCAEAIVAAGLRRVVVAIGDPDPRTAGQGIQRLRAAGIEVAVGVCARDATWMALGHILRVREARPFVQVKIATDAAGRVPRGENGRPTWVTGRQARALGHLLRARADAVLVGIGTVRDDDPELTCRLPGLQHRSPDRVVLDGRLATPAAARLMPRPGSAARVFIGTTASADVCDASPLGAKGALVLPGLGTGGADSAVDVRKLLRTLAGRGITRLLVEGGPSVWRSFAEAGVVDEAVLLQASGAGAPGAPEAGEVLNRYLPASAMRLAEQRKIGHDVCSTFRREQVL